MHAVKIQKNDIESRKTINIKEFAKNSKDRWINRGQICPLEFQVLSQRVSKKITIISQMSYQSRQYRQKLGLGFSHNLDIYLKYNKLSLLYYFSNIFFAECGLVSELQHCKSLAIGPILYNMYRESYKQWYYYIKNIVNDMTACYYSNLTLIVYERKLHLKKTNCLYITFFRILFIFRLDRGTNSNHNRLKELVTQLLCQIWDRRRGNSLPYIVAKHYVKTVIIQTR